MGIDNRDPTAKSKPSRAETATRAHGHAESSRRQVFDSTARVIDRRCYAPVRSARSARSSSPWPKLALSLSYFGDRRNSRKRPTKHFLHAHRSGINAHVSFGDTLSIEGKQVKSPLCIMKTRKLKTSKSLTQVDQSNRHNDKAHFTDMSLAHAIGIMRSV